MATEVKKVFISKNKVRINDTDMMGILYYANQFRFCTDALEDLFESEGFNFDRFVSRDKFVFVVVHCESDYLKSIAVGENLDVHVTVEKIGTTSFVLNYAIYRHSNDLVGKAKTVHVVLDSESRVKIPIPNAFLETLKKYHH